MERKFLVFSGAALLTAVTAVAPRAWGWCRTTTRRPSVPGECVRTGIPLAWQSVCAGFSLHVSGSPEIAMEVLRTESEAAAARWHQVPCDANSTTQPYFRLLRIADTSMPTGYNPRGANANTVSFNPIWQPDALHRVGTIAITVVTFNVSNGEILDADVELNQQSDQNPDGFRFTTEVSRMDSADLPTILTHEFGHFQGLSHSEDPSAVMWPEAGLGEQRRNLRNDDAQAICDAYNPDRAPDQSCNPVPYGGFAVDSFGGRVKGGCSCETAPASENDFRIAMVAMAAASAVFLQARRRSMKE